MELSSDSFLNQPPDVSVRQQQKAGKPVMFSSQQQQIKNRPTSASAKKQKTASASSYKDWQVREEPGKKAKTKKTGNSSMVSTQKLGATSSSASRHTNTTTQRKSSQKNGSKATTSLKSKSRSKSRPRSSSKDTTDDIRKRVQLQFQNYMQTKENLDESISLLEDSQATPSRDVKKQILEEQKHQRKRSDADKKKQDLIELKKKEDALQALELRFKSQTAVFKKELQAGKRTQELKDKQMRSKKSPSNSNYQSSSKAGDKPPKAYNSYNVGKQVSELRRWIDDAIKDEKLVGAGSQSGGTLATDQSAQNLQIPGVQLFNANVNKASTKKQSKSKSKDRVDSTELEAPQQKKKQNSNTSAYTNPSVSEYGSTKSGKVKMLKHQLPGNNVLTDQEQSKLGSRKDRYGVFGADGDSEFDKVVGVEKNQMMVELNGQAKNQKWQPNKEESKQVKQVLDDALKSLGSRTDIRASDQGSSSAEEVESEFEGGEYDDEDSEDNAVGRRTPNSEDSTDKIPVKQTAGQKQYRAMFNQQLDAEDQENALNQNILPGVVDTQAHFDKIEKAKKDKEAKAALFIQKTYRGFRGRKYFKKEDAKHKQRLVFEYEQLNRELKNDTQYNLKTYLAEKKKVRKQTGIADSLSADSIAEIIGESSNDKSQAMRQKRQNASGAMQFQNFFKTDDKNKNKAQFKDPNSLIAIFAKRNGVIPNQEKSRSLRPDKVATSSSRSRHRHKKGISSSHQKANPALSTDSMAIEEEYSADFSDSLPKEQSIMEEDMPKTSSSGSKSKKVSSGQFGSSRKDQSKGKARMLNKDESDSILNEIIDEESFQQSKADADSIKTESIINELESNDTGKKKDTDSIAEDSIIRSEYDNDNYKVHNANLSLEAKNRVKYGMHSAVQPKPETELDKIKSADQLKLAAEQEHSTLERNRMISGLMTEMKEYEKATMSTTLLDRIEKIIVSSMAQKDQIIMAQRLSELEAESRHKEEINKIREEQIKLMSQLMLLGTGVGGAPGGHANSGMNEKQRTDLLASIQKIIEKPIAIRNETVHVNYSVSKGVDDQLQASGQFGASVSAARKSYLEEYDESKKLEKQGNIVTQSSAIMMDIVEEDIALRLGKDAVESSQSKRGKHQDSIDDLVGDVTSLVEESIRDEIGDSHSRMSNSKMSKNSRDQQAAETSKFRANKNTAASVAPGPQADKAEVFLAEVEKAIDSERSDREDRLARDLKKRRISPAEYDRGIKEIEKWVVNEKQELYQRRRKLMENQKDMNKYIEKFRKDKQSVPMLTKVASPRPDSARRSYLDDSANSEQLQTANRQAYLLEKELAGLSPEQKHTMKKREAAVQLLEQKEKAIQKALNEKLNKYQGGVAEDLLQKALELDIEAEVQRRFENAKYDIEESRNLESARSNHSHEKAGGTGRTKKSVQFAPSVHSRATRGTAASTERIAVQAMDEDSIEESIQLAESISQSLRSQSVTEVSKSRSAQKLQVSAQQAQDKFSPQSRAKQQRVIDEEKADSESMIASDYSQEFTEPSVSSKDVSQSQNVSKAKLQAKAKDIEESAAYSETFEEESLSKSMTIGKDESVGKALKMDTVKEESVDDSAAEQSKDVSQSISASSKASPARAESSIGSLPSEDISVKDSVRSVDWKYDINKDSARTESEAGQEASIHSEKKTSFIKEEKVEDSEEDSSEEDIQSSSDLNTRDEFDDLDSCPDAVGQSASASANEHDILAKADMITEELFELLMNDYKDDDEFNLNASQDQPDEEDFRDKFPWTMDKKPEPKPAPKPHGVQVGAQPRPPKTLREIQDEEFKKKHEESKKLLDDRDNQVIEFMDFMCKRVDLRELMESLNKPITRDPMKILSQIVNCYDEDESLDKAGDSTLMHAQQQILQQGFFNKMDREYIIMKRMKVNRAAVEDSDQLTVSQEEMENINNVHHYALFESLNEALDASRPYQNKGEPMPWSKSTRVVKKIESEVQAKKVLEKARDQTIKWMRMRAGTNQAPLPDAPAQTQDEMGEEIVPPPLEEGEEERRNNHRQEKLAELMTDDIIENDSLWVDYEIQDTQTRFDVADMILHHLAGEIAEFLAEKGMQQ